MQKERILMYDKQFLLMKESQNATKKIRHDLKNHIMLLEHFLSEKKYEDVIAYAVKGLAIDPLSEQLHGMIILSLLGQGNRKLAMNHYNQTIKMFEQEYNITPTGSFLDLNRQLSHPEIT